MEERCQGENANTSICGFSRKLFEQLVLTRPHLGLQIICNMSERHENLGFPVGAHRVSVTRALKELKQAGKVLTDGCSFIIPPPAE
jgi:CRP/FNR family transcriptional regulator